MSFFVGVGGEVVVIAPILLMAGVWDRRKAERAGDEHDVWLTAAMATPEQ